jgi:hypothetical protein
MAYLKPGRLGGLIDENGGEVGLQTYSRHQPGEHDIAPTM